MEAICGFSLLPSIIDCIKTIIPKANITITNEGFECQAMDNCHISIVKFVLKLSAFEEIKIENEMVIGLDIEFLDKILAGLKKNKKKYTWLHLQVLDEDRDHFYITSADEGNNETQFKLNLLQINQNEHVIADFPGQSKIFLFSSTLLTICNQLNGGGDNVNIIITKDMIRFTIKGETSNNAGVNYPLKRRNAVADNDEDCGIIECEDGFEETCIKLSFSYMLKFSKAAILGPLVYIIFGKDIPVAFRYDFHKEDEEDDFGYLVYYLAPKQTDD